MEESIMDGQTISSQVNTPLSLKGIDIGSPPTINPIFSHAPRRVHTYACFS